MRFLKTLLLALQSWPRRPRMQGELADDVGRPSFPLCVQVDIGPLASCIETPTCIALCVVDCSPA